MENVPLTLKCGTQQAVHFKEIGERAPFVPRSTSNREYTCFITFEIHRHMTLIQ